MIRPAVASFAFALLPFAVLPGVALAQAAPASAPQASPSPQASPAPASSTLYPALAANDPCTSLSAIVTRPSVTNSVCTVRPNHVLIETGYLNTSAAGGGQTVSYPQTLIRVGTAVPALEFDIAPPTVTRASTGGVTTTGNNDAGVGLKYVLGYTPKANYGALVFVSAPTGSNGFSASGTQTTYALQGGYTLSPAVSLAGTVQSLSLTNGTQRWSSFVPSLVLSGTLPGGTALFAEIAQFGNALGPASPVRTQYVFGADRDIGQRLQLDFSVGISPTAATGKYHAVGVGASYYF